MKRLHRTKAVIGVLGQLARDMYLRDFYTDLLGLADEYTVEEVEEAADRRLAEISPYGQHLMSKVNIAKEFLLIPRILDIEKVLL